MKEMSRLLISTVRKTGAENHWMEKMQVQIHIHRLEIWMEMET